MILYKVNIYRCAKQREVPKNNNSKQVVTPLPTLHYLNQHPKAPCCEKFGRQVLTQRRQKSHRLTQVQERWGQDSSTQTFTNLPWNLFAKKSHFL